MKRLFQIILITCLLAGSFGLAPEIAPLPTAQAAVTNDDISAARVISIGEYAQNVWEATSTASDPSMTCLTSASNRNKSVWFRFTPPATGTYYVDTRNTDYSSYYGVFSGTPGALAQVGCSSYPSSVNAFTLTGGVGYYIVVYAYAVPYSSEYADLLFRVYRGPINDTAATATTVTNTTSSSTQLQTPLGAGNVGDNIPSCGSPITNGVWYKWTPTVSAKFVFDTADQRINGTGTFNTVMAMFTGTPASLTQIGCSNESNNLARIEYTVTSGTTYYFLLANLSTALTTAQRLYFNITRVAGNDVITAPVNIPAGAPPYTVSQNFNGTTKDGSETASCAYNASNVVWFKYTPTTTRTVIADMYGSLEAYSALIAVFTGTPGSLTQIACSTARRAWFNATAGTTYYILVGRTSSYPVSLNTFFTFSLSLPVTNDLPTTAKTVAGNPYIDTVDMRGSINNTGEPSDTCFGGTGVNGSVWYKYTPNVTRPVQAHTVGSNFDSVLAVYTGTPGSLTQLVCADGGGPSGTSFLTFNAVAGTVYYIRVVNYNGSLTNAPIMKFTLEAIVAVPNDLPTTATNINTNPFVRVQDLRGATTYTNEPSDTCGGFTGQYGSVWFKYTSPVARIFNVDTAESGFDTTIAIYTGTPTALTQVACNDDASAGNPTSAILGYTAQPNVTYYIRVAVGTTYPAYTALNMRFNFEVIVPTCAQGLDLMFVLDGSGSIASSDFQIMKGFVKNVVANFNVSPSQARFGIVQFDGSTRLEIDISSNAGAIYNALDNIVQLGGSTAIGDGIQLGQSRLVANPRAGVYRFMVVLTDGQNNSGAVSPEVASTNARNAGTRIFGVAVGSGPDINQINAIASDPDDQFVYNVSQYIDLLDVLRRLVSSTCVAPRLKAETVGVFRPTGQNWYFRTTNTSGPAQISALFGLAGDVPVTGDWDGNGIDSIGVFRPSQGKFYLSNSNSGGSPAVNYIFSFGQNGDIPVAGDWNGDGRDTIGVFRPSEGKFYLRDTLTAGVATYVISFGVNGDRPIAGDWNGDGFDSPGVHRNASSFFLTNAVCVTCIAGVNYAQAFGIAGDLPVVGDWDGNGADGIGVYRQSAGRHYLRNSATTAGPVNITVIFGINVDRPLAGYWAAPVADPVTPGFVPRK